VPHEISGREKSLNTEELRRRIEQGEGETLELKTSIPRPDAVAQQLAAFANTKGGLLVLGVKEPAVIVGVDPNRAAAVLQRAQDFLMPHLKVQVETHEIEGKSVVVMHVPATPQLVASSGGYYRRFGEHFRPLSAEEIRDHAQAGKSSGAALKELAAAVASQTATIDTLRDEFRKVNSWPRKIAIAVVGAVAGVIGKYLLEALL